MLCRNSLVSPPFSASSPRAAKLAQEPQGALVWEPFRAPQAPSCVVSVAFFQKGPGTDSQPNPNVGITGPAPDMAPSRSPPVTSQRGHEHLHDKDDPSSPHVQSSIRVAALASLFWQLKAGGQSFKAAAFGRGRLAFPRHFPAASLCARGLLQPHISALSAQHTPVGI